MLLRCFCLFLNTNLRGLNNSYILFIRIAPNFEKNLQYLKKNFTFYKQIQANKIQISSMYTIPNASRSNTIIEKYK